MATSYGLDWAGAVCAICDPVFEAAGVGFRRQPLSGAHGESVTALLWEADPGRFAERYPDSEIIDSYGLEQWPGVHCIDYWVYVDGEARQARISVEGWNLDDQVLALTGHGTRDGLTIADRVARILGVASPRP